MKLNETGLKNRSEWEAAGIRLPAFDREQVCKKTSENPAWIHFGAGNIFRAFPAAVQQTLLEQGVSDTGIIVAEGFDYEIIDKVHIPYDNLSLLVTLKADGGTQKTVIASIVEAYKLDSALESEFSALKRIFSNPSLQMASFTITEKGYSLMGMGGGYQKDVAEDFKNGPGRPQSYMGKVAALCYERYLNGAPPLAMVSMDNCSHNGDKLFAAISAFAQKWEESGLARAGFAAYICDPDRVSFPWSMIDKITPRPDSGVVGMLEALGFEDAKGAVTSKNTYVAPFVNAEETEYLVIEDAFPNGRPPLEQGGVIFTDRETVDKVEKMKVCTCLNPLHTALAVFGCLLGYTKISDEMKDDDLVALIEGIGYREGLPVVVDPGILSPRAFIDQVIKVRLPNPFMPDAPQRIASDTSQKLPIRFGETIKAYMQNEGLDPKSLKLIPLVLAGWLRYLLAVDDQGREFERSPDPKLPQLTQALDGIRLGQAGPVHDKLAPILCDSEIFGVNLYDAGLGEIVEELFAALIESPGAVRNTLHEAVNK